MRCWRNFLPAVIALLSLNVLAGPTLTEFWNGRGKWVKDADKIGSGFGFHFPSIHQTKSGLEAFYIHHYVAKNGRLKMTVGLAYGADGVNWADDGQVLDVGADGMWDDRLASFPGVCRDGDKWYLVYEGAGETPFSPGDIGLASSEEGSNFVKCAGNPILKHDPQSWERANIGTPSLYKENGLWYLFYHGFDGTVCQIGVASGRSLTNLTKSSANPIVPVTPGTTAWDTGTIGRRSRIVQEGPWYYFAFEGSTPQPYDRAKWSSGLARSTNLLGGWTKFPGNPILPQTPGGMGNDGPELLRLNGSWFLYVRERGNTTARFRLIAE